MTAGNSKHDSRGLPASWTVQHQHARGRHAAQARAIPTSQPESSIPRGRPHADNPDRPRTRAAARTTAGSSQLVNAEVRGHCAYRRR
jgi:hypothetical protein